jgi:hypothetical protein
MGLPLIAFLCFIIIGVRADYTYSGSLDLDNKSYWISELMYPPGWLSYAIKNNNISITIDLISSIELTNCKESHYIGCNNVYNSTNFTVAQEYIPTLESVYLLIRCDGCGIVNLSILFKDESL